MQTFFSALTALINPKVLVALIATVCTVGIMIASVSLISAIQETGAGQTQIVDGSYLTETLEGADEAEAAAIRKILNF